MNRNGFFIMDASWRHCIGLGFVDICLLWGTYAGKSYCIGICSADEEQCYQYLLAILLCRLQFDRIFFRYCIVALWMVFVYGASVLLTGRRLDDFIRDIVEI